MKTKFAIVTMTLIMSLLSFTAGAQTYGDIEITVGVFTLGHRYTDEQIKDITGSDHEIIQTIGSNNIGIFHYEANTFYTNNGTLYCFELANDKLKLDGVVGVGDSFDKALDDVNLIKGDCEKGHDGLLYHYAYAIDDRHKQSPVTFYVKDNIITRITYLKHDEMH